MKAEFNIDTQEFVREIAQELIKVIKPLLSKNAIECDTILDIKGLAEYLKVTQNWIYQQTHLNTIPYMKLGNQLRFKKKDIDRWLETLKTPDVNIPTGHLRAVK